MSEFKQITVLKMFFVENCIDLVNSHFTCTKKALILGKILQLPIQISTHTHTHNPPPL